MGPQIRYDKASDALLLAFGPMRSATGIELNENLLLRVDKVAREPVGLTILNFSILAGKGEKSLPLHGLSEPDETFRGLVLEILLRPPVSEYLEVEGSVASIHPIPFAPA